MRITNTAKIEVVYLDDTQLVVSTIMAFETPTKPPTQQCGLLWPCGSARLGISPTATVQRKERISAAYHSITGDQTIKPPFSKAVMYSNCLATNLCFISLTAKSHGAYSSTSLDPTSCKAESWEYAVIYR